MSDFGQPNQPYPAPQPGPNQPPPYFPPRKSHKLRTTFIVIGASFVGLIGLAALVPNSNPQSTPPAAVQTVDNGPTPDPITTPTNKPSAVEPTQPARPSSAPKLTAGQEQAIGSAQQYLSFTAFSRKGLIQQLSSDAGEGFSVADATYAVDHITVNWNEQAAKAARSYLEMTHFSRQGLVHQLESDAGDGFTHRQAVYGVSKAGL